MVCEHIANEDRYLHTDTPLRPFVGMGHLVCGHISNTSRRPVIGAGHLVCEYINNEDDKSTKSHG